MAPDWVKEQAGCLLADGFVARRENLYNWPCGQQYKPQILMMNIGAVLVSYKLEGDENSYETSGILFNRDMVLLTGTSLIPLLQQDEWVSSLVKLSFSELTTNECIEKVSFRVFLECHKDSENEKVPKKIEHLESKAVGIWKCPLISESLKKLFYDWTVGHMNYKNESEISADYNDLSKELMSLFIVLRCRMRGESAQTQGNNKSDEVRRALLNLKLRLQKPSRGREIEVVSTPFGNAHFMNSLSRGVIGNVVGCKKCIILSDVRTVSGCEGGPIFLAQRSRNEKTEHKLVGIVACPLTWWRGEWVGLTLGISLMPVLKKLLKIEDDIACGTEYAEKTSHGFSSGAGINYKLKEREVTSGPAVIGNLIRTKDLMAVNFIDEIVVLIRSTTSWGSGVILSAASGVIITCSHVVTDDKTVSVFQTGIRFFADVVFKSQDDVAYDLAIVKVRNNFMFMNEARVSKNLGEIGETVVAAGFPFFSEKDDLSVRPSITTGCIASINPHMIQTTCCIQSGFSGGALFRDEELLGIIICNTRDSAAGALFPFINFVVPSSVFKEPVFKYIKTNDVQNLRDMECSNAKVQSLWKLQTSKL